MWDGSQKGANPSLSGKKTAEKTMDNLLPAGLRGRVILGKGNRMDRYDPYTDKFLRDTQYNILGTNLASLGTDCISRQAAIDAINEYMVGKRCDTDGTMMARLINELVIKQLPPIQPDNNLQKLADEIASFKRRVKSDNSDYLTGYLCAFSVVEGMIADMRREVTT